VSDVTCDSSVVLVDDQHLVRAGFRMVIDSQPDLQVVGEASDGVDALELLAERQPTSSSWTCACRGSTASRPPGASSTCPTRRG
jgi:hypothetical protein